MNVRKWIENNTHSLVGKKVAVSGSTGGIGRELCAHFASLGASLVLVDRNAERSIEGARRIKEQFPSTEISRVYADMENIESVKRAADELLAHDVDFLVLNAGAYSIPRHICDTGYDNVFQINFISPYFMIRKLLPVLEKKGGRVVAVGSIAHNYSKTDPDDIDFRTRKRSSDVYGNSKRYLMYALLSLFKERKGTSLAVCHPGITFTNITAHYPKLIFAVIKHPMKVIFMKPRRAALSVLAGLFREPSAVRPEWIGPRYFDIWGIPKVKRLRTASDDERERIFEVAEGIYLDLKK
jgi:NAD(P)-dependent dehydrogenase (short-subunit alcohol dehydrogenase family)